MRIINLVFSRIIYLKRKELKLSQEAMAEKLDISTRTYVDLENGKHEPSTKTLINTAIVLGLSLDEFISELIKEGYCITDKEK